MKSLLLAFLASPVIAGVTPFANSPGVSDTVTASTVTVTGTGSKCFSVDDPTLVVDCGNDRVGIGTPTPATKLHCSTCVLTLNGTGASINVGSGAGAVVNITVGDALGGNDGVIRAAAGRSLILDGGTSNGGVTIRNNAGGSNAIVVAGSSGNVGIGSSSPGAKLEALTASGNNVVASSSTASGFGVIMLHGASGGCIMLTDTDNAGWTECKALNGTLSCATDADGICD